MTVDYYNELRDEVLLVLEDKTSKDKFSSVFTTIDHDHGKPVAWLQKKCKDLRRAARKYGVLEDVIGEVGEKHGV